MKHCKFKKSYGQSYYLSDYFYGVKPYNLMSFGVNSGRVHDGFRQTYQ